MMGELRRKIVQEWGSDVDHLIRSCSPELICLGIGLSVRSSWYDLGINYQVIHYFSTACCCFETVNSAREVLHHIYAWYPVQGAEVHPANPLKRITCAYMSMLKCTWLQILKGVAKVKFISKDKQTSGLAAGKGRSNRSDNRE
ncbi:hypothetical protein KY285_020583 [Solanum tuberosum]|nr:hypothetical protein KY285_020583 [Solanum tuberosum]